MVATFWLLGWVLATAQTPPRPAAPAPSVALRSDWILTPRLARGQELVYRGTYNEEATGARVEFQRGYRFEGRYFVLETPPRGYDVAAMVVLHDRTQRPNQMKQDPTSIRLERFAIDLNGRVSSSVSLAVPLEAPPTIEVGMFVEAPRGKKAPQPTWDTPDGNRPAISWRVAGTETIASQLCVKLVGVQQSDDWERPRADRSAWRRAETAWVAVRSGTVQRFERVIEHHEPARTEVSRRSVLRYELETGLQLPSQMAFDRRQEIQQTLSFRETAAPLLGEPAKHAKPLHDLQRRLGQYLDTPPTPYREAVYQIKRQVDAACKGEAVSLTYEEVPTRAVTAAVPGEAAPDFVAGPITTKEPGRLSKWKGKPILLLFYHPSSATATDMLRFAQHLHLYQGRAVTVVGLPVVDDTSLVLKQRDALGLQFPLYSGGGMRISYGVETTPKVVLIDSIGTVRGMYLGWGRETSEEVMNELRRWMNPSR